MVKLGIALRESLGQGDRAKSTWGRKGNRRRRKRRKNGKVVKNEGDKEEKDDLRELCDWSMRIKGMS